MYRKIIGLILIGALAVIWSGFYFNSDFGIFQSETSDDDIDGRTSILEVSAQEAGDRPVRTFDLTAQETEWEIDQEKTVDAWTYNGSVPGEALRVKEGDFVRVHLKNELNVPVTIHWHGMILPNRMDGVPGLTQDAVQPGESFTYEFIANDAGTYWYHSHQHSSEQVDKGLYGSLIIEEKQTEKQNDFDQDKVFILDEWTTDQAQNQGMGGMMGAVSGDAEVDTKQAYDTFTINGKSGQAIESLVMTEGQTARMRFVNAGYQQHQLVFPKGSMEVIANDGEEVDGSKGSSNVLEIAPGERIDIAFTKPDSGSVVIGENPDVENAEDMQIPVVSREDSDDTRDNDLAAISGQSVAKGTSYGSENLIFEEPPEPDVTYNMDLSMGMNMGEGMTFQINQKVFPDTPPIQVEEGDIVKVNIQNSGRMNHPMHLHGHRFQVMSKNGNQYDEPIVKDLIHVKPGEEYEIYFKANNKGEWLFHCHDNNHADQGMVTIVDYKDVYSPFKIGGDHQNQP
ncbi:Multicopper oxidase with three cupredoxin domains (includes cell division protein FtsP and spore coat protein CotA) [Virgibacillus subterraneus]|uniref:Copper-containing nitrite reductase n=1 Tax=Virgibacillus subterraneus TaxID=621109 RepID=A0A1H9JP99_9BACI|nr:multicopper oxidase family protein [Virgibacillus subterraneus]SEQ88619.1 Multicopper oxidase with three cupredoxin domains (includes cell division protein FtsP and spore coat protein CotA) [Virgibacillus subterraneus]